MRTILNRLAPLSLYACALAMMLPMAGCKKPKYPQCKKDKHCKVDLGEKCVDGQCQNCTTNDDCKGKGPGNTDWICHEFRCQDPNAIQQGSGTGDVGAPCTDASSCKAGLVCTDGKCANCIDDTQCSGGTCDLGTGLCSTPGGGKACTSDDQCAMDEICENGTCVFSDVKGGTNPCGLDAVFFDFDSPTLSQEASDQLKGVADCLKQQNRLVYLEAHADQRGTEEYNIMLTDKRGNTVKKFLGDLGVTETNMQVVSKGDLEATGTDEASMAKDRRVEFVWP